MKKSDAFKYASNILIILVLGVTALPGRLVATDNPTGGAEFAAYVAKVVATQPLDLQALRRQLAPRGWGVLQEADGTISLIPGACRQTAPPAILANQTRDVMALMKGKGYGCLSCHQVDTRLHAPSYKEVADKRRCHKWAFELLTFKLSKAAVGPYETAHHMQQISEEDAPIIVNWILSM